MMALSGSVFSPKMLTRAATPDHQTRDFQDTMLIKREVLEAIKRGEITVQFRRWKRATVRAGGTLKTRVGVLSIGRMDPITVEAVTEEDCRKAGFKDKPDFIKWLATMKDGDLCRIEIGYLGEAAS